MKLSKKGLKTLFSKKIILILMVLIAINIAYAVPQIPKQVYGSITPALNANYPMSFQINDVQYETGTAALNRYGYDPLVLVPVDDPATVDVKEGYANGDNCIVYINGILIDSQQYPASVNKIDIVLTQEQVNQIQGTARIPAPSGGGGGRPPPGCYEEWVCGDWSPCNPEGTQTRFCKDEGTCGRPDKIEEQVCAYVPAGVPGGELPAEEEIIPDDFRGFEEEGRGLLTFVLIVIVAGGLGFVFYEWEKSRKKLGTEMTGKKLKDKSLQRLNSYVNMTLEEGYTRPQIRQALQKEGWSPEIIKQVLK